MSRPVSLLLAAALLFLPVRAGADARTAFQAAHQLFERGDYDEALHRYEEAYRLAPHKNTLYNLALTRERLLDYDGAIDAFARYLAEPLAQDPATRHTEQALRLLAERSLRRLRGLPARISVSAVPRAAEASAFSVLANGDEKGREGAAFGAAAWRGQTPAVFKVPAGRYRLRFSAPGYLTEEMDLDAHVGQALLVERALRPAERHFLIESFPRAEVALDDQALGLTPQKGSVPPGSHTLHLSRLFFLTRAERLDVVPDAAILHYHVTLQRSGLSEMILGGLLAGAGLGLVALRVVTGNELEATPKGQIYRPVVAMLLPGLLGAGLLAVGGGNNMSKAQAQLILGSAAWGTLVGLSLGLLGDPEGVLPHTLAAAGGLLGGVLGLGVYRWRQPDSGAVARFNSGAMWGTTIGALGWGYLTALDPRNTFFGRDPARGGSYSGTGGLPLLTGAVLGIGGGLLLANMKGLRGLSRRQVTYLDLGGLCGGATAGLAGLGIGYAATGVWQKAGQQSATSIAALASIGGILLGTGVAGLLVQRLSRPARMGMH